MNFVIIRASDPEYRKGQPCAGAEAIPALIQRCLWSPEANKGVWKHEPRTVYIVKIDSLQGLIALIGEVNESIILYDTPYLIGDRRNDAPWPESIRSTDGQPLEILKDAHGIFIYDDYMG